MSLTNSQDPGSRYVFNYAQGGYNFDIYGSGTLVIHQNVFMNGAVIDSTIQYNKEGDTISEKYIYWGGNELKYLTTYKVTSSGSQVINGTEYIYGFNDELILEQDYFSTTSYTYNTIVANNFDLYPVYVNRSKQLPSKITYSNSTGEKTWNHTYTFDAQHRLIADSIFASTGGVTLKKFTYE